MRRRLYRLNVDELQQELVAIGRALYNSTGI